MSANSEWDTTDWLTSARGLVHWVGQQSPDNRIMLLLRHSHRAIISDHSAQFSTELTDIGKQMSFEMGKRLPIENPARFFFSFVPRCYQTAEEMANGTREAGGEVTEFEPLAILVAPEIANDKVWDALQPDGKNVTDFVNRWADGLFGDMIEDFEDYRVKLIEDTLGRLSKESGPAIHVHITHDLALMAIKRILLQRPVGYEDREPFLGGICSAIDSDGSWCLYDSGVHKPLSMPEY